MKFLRSMHFSSVSTHLLEASAARVEGGDQIHVHLRTQVFYFNGFNGCFAQCS